MKSEIDFDAIENATGKISTGFRCEPELKLQLVTEANDLGIKLSEHLENTLANRHVAQLEIERLKAEIEKQKTQLLSQANEISRLTGQIELQKKELNDLKTQSGQQSQQVAIFNNPFLLALFEKLKGRDDIIDASDGKQYSFKYNSPADLILAMIYSFRLKK